MFSCGFTITSANPSAIICEDFTNFWKRDPITLNNFKYIPQNEVNEYMEKFPRKFSKKPTTDEDNLAKKGREKSKSPGDGRSPKAKGIEPSEWAEILLLNLGDNQLAEFICDALNTRHQLTISCVSTPI